MIACATVGGSNDVSMTQAEKDRAITKQIKQALKQLKKSVQVLKHLVSDLPVTPPILPTLILPNVSDATLRRLAYDPTLTREMTGVLGNNPSSACLTRESSGHQLTITSWWPRMGRDRGTSVMTIEIYLDLLARFVGPATSIRVHCSNCPALATDEARDDGVRTRGQGVVETSYRFTRVVLHPEQLKLLNKPPHEVGLVGPAGTGKTLVMAVRGQHLVSQGEHVLNLLWFCSSFCIHILC